MHNSFNIQPASVGLAEARPNYHEQRTYVGIWSGKKLLQHVKSAQQRSLERTRSRDSAN